MKTLGTVEIDHEEDEFGVVTSHGEAMWCDDEIDARVWQRMQGGLIVKRRVFYGEIERVETDSVQSELDGIIKAGGDGDING